MKLHIAKEASCAAQKYVPTKGTTERANCFKNTHLKYQVSCIKK